MNAIEKTIEMVSRGLVVPVNPAYLFADRITEQQNKMLLGQRTSFLAFNRFMYFLSDNDLSLLLNEYKKEFLEQSKAFPDDRFVDMSLMIDAIQLQIALRDDNQADNPAICEQIAISFKENAQLANDFTEIDSKHLIDLADKLIKRAH